MRVRLAEAEPVPRPKSLRFLLPANFCHAMLPNLPANITLYPGRLKRSSEAI